MSKLLLGRCGAPPTIRDEGGKLIKGFGNCFNNTCDGVGRDNGIDGNASCQLNGSTVPGCLSSVSGSRPVRA